MTKIASHRGGALLWPENSRTAFENTAKLEVDQVEFDVQLTADGQVIVLHDPDLARTTNQNGLVEALTWPTIQQAILRGTEDQRILLLEEVLTIYQGSDVNIRLEIKYRANFKTYSGLVAQVVQLLKDQDMVHRTTISSFSLPVLRDVMSYHLGLEGLLWLVHPHVFCAVGCAGIAKLAHEYQITDVSLKALCLDQDVVDQLTGAGLRVGGWAAHTAADINKMFALKVSAFTSDRPDLAIDIKKSHFSE